MESTLPNAFLLLAVGMITVFVILSLVVATGSLLIRITNNMYKEPVKEVESGIPTKTVAILSAVVDHITHGQGSIGSIEEK